MNPHKISVLLLALMIPVSALYAQTKDATKDADKEFRQARIDADDALDSALQKLSSGVFVPPGCRATARGRDQEIAFAL